MGHIHHDEIHTDLPHHRRPLSMDQHLPMIREMMAIPIRISNREGSDEALPLCLKCPSVTNPCSRGNRFQKMDTGFEGHDRLEWDETLKLGRRIRAIKHDSRSDQLG